MKAIIISGYEAWINKEGKAMPGCKPYDADFYTEMFHIRDGYYKNIIEQCRAIPNKEERNKFKCERLPSLSISAICKGWRKLENVVRHTGLLNLDVDYEGNEQIQNWGELRDLIFKRPLVVAAFLSASGRGLSFVVKIDPVEHKDTFFSIVDECKEHLNIKIDSALHDVVRLRFVSYDPGMKIREDFDKIPLCRPSANYLSFKKHYGRPLISLEPVGLADSPYNFNEAVKRTEQMYEFTEGQKHSYLTSLAGGCNIMGMSLSYCEQSVITNYRERAGIIDEKLLKPVRNVYKTYKHQHGSFNAEAKYERLNKKITEIIVRDYLHEGVRPTDDDLSNIARENEANIERVNDIYKRIWGEYEDEFGFKKFLLIKKVEVWLQKRWNFLFNKISNQPEQKTLGEKEYEPINNDEVYRQLQLNNLKFSFNNIKSLFKSNYIKQYDPIEEYFKSLTWDGVDYIDKLSGYITCNNKEFWQEQFKKTLVRCIPCGLGLQENRIVLVLQGDQETGKSSYIRFLNPWGTKKYYTESPIHPDKDTELKFTSNFIYNLEELAVLNSNDIEKLKAIISKRSVKERRVWAEYEYELPRRCNFFGSTNQQHFLHDSENTRWLVFAVDSIEWSYSKEIDIHQVWAEAWWLYNNGFNYNLTKEERVKREETNEGFRVHSSEEDLILRHYKPAEPGDIGCNFYTPSEIAGWLGAKYTLKLSGIKIGRTLKAAFNIERQKAWIDGRRIWGYWLIKIEQTISAESTPF